MRSLGLDDVRFSDNYLSVQQDMLETFLNRGEMERLGQPTVLDNEKRIPGLRVNHPRQLALMHALVRFSHLVAGGLFTTTELLPHVVETLDCSVQYSARSFRQAQSSSADAPV